MLKTLSSVLLLLFVTAAQAGYTYKTDSGIEFEVGGRIVLQYRDYEITDFEADDAFELVGDDGQILDQDDAFALTTADQEYRIRRFRPSLDVTFNDDWEASLSWELAGGRRNVKDAYVRYRGIEWLDIKVGNETVPFSRERMTSSARQHSAERGIMGSTEFGVPGRHPGIHLRTRFDYPLNLRLSYVDANIDGDILTEIQFITPWGASSVDNNQQDEGTMTVARLEYKVFGRGRYREGDLSRKPSLHLSAAMMDWDNKDDVVEIDHVDGWELAAAYRGYDWSVDLQYHEISATSPYTIGRRLFDDGKAEVQTFGVEVGHLFFEKQLEIFGSYQVMAADEWERDWKVYEFGASYLLDKHNHKVQVSYRRENDRKGHDVDKNTLYVQWQYNF